MHDEQKYIEQNESKEIIDKVFEYYKKEYSPLTDHWQKLPYDALSFTREQERIALLEKDTGIQVKGKRVLNVGSGIGSFDIAMQKYGADIYGIEPDDLEYAIAIERIENKGLKCNIQKAVGEKLPFMDDFFDLVTSFQVMEHVQNPGEVIKEMVRVTKKNGIIYINMPNHNSFWEGHYGCFWWPHFYKPLAKLYIKYIRKKDENFLDTINYLSPQKIKRELKKHNLINKIEILDWGIKTFENRLDNLNFSTWGHTSKIKSAVTVIKKLRLTSFIKWVNKNMYNFYYPMILIVRKK
jgi:ubiquinone/menaquinone biosynthesis C-methylase UbiE